MAQAAGDGRWAAAAELTVTIAHLRQLYLQHLEGRVTRGDYGRETYRKTRVNTKTFLAFNDMGELPCSRLDRSHAAAYRDWAIAWGHKPSYVSGLV